uniref:Uncharacterized protein n=1 Tax=Arundo donax TaxID=35708 RepID=A0A0A8YQ00_ARUDO
MCMHTRWTVVNFPLKKHLMSVESCSN